MTKLRVHELAKELDKTNKEVLDFLKKENVDVKSHMSSLEEEQVLMVKKAFSSNPEEEKKEEAPKKKNIAMVFRPQNTRDGGRSMGRKGMNRPNNNASGGNNNEGRQRGMGTSRTGAGQMRPEGRDVQRTGGYQNRDGAKDTKREGQRPEQRTERRTENRTDNRVNGRNENRTDSRANGKNENRVENRNGFRTESRGPRRDGDRGTRQGGFQNRDGAREKNFQKDREGARNGNRFQGGNNRRDTRKEGRTDMPSIPAPAVVEQKATRQKGKDTYNNKKKDYRDDDREEKMPKAGKKPKAAPAPQKPQPKVEKQEEQVKMITIGESITIQELAEKMKLQPSAIVKKLFMQGKIVTINQEVDFETAEEIAMEFEVLCEKEEVVDVIEELLKEDEEDEKKMKKRPPVVCVMGHVDHGKTSLLDAIRKTNVTDKEAGGITQAIGAYTVNINNQKITFLDTPGHEAFTAMRMRGANATDIAVLVIAADDGVMPQTVEAINHAKAAGIEIIVAVNKIDKPNANIDRVKQEMTEYELIPVDWGGSTEFVPVSAKSGEGIETLLETILITSEILELKANPDRRARGLVIEAELDKGRGPVATVLVQKGTLHIGDFISAGAWHGKVRAMIRAEESKRQNLPCR